VSLLMLMGVAEVDADDFKLAPSFSLKQEYEDNVFFTASAKSSFITTASAGVSLLESTERFSTRLNARLDGLIYSPLSDLNALEQRYAALGTYLLTPLLQMDARAAFSRESRPDRLIDSSGLVVSQKSSHQNYGVTGRAIMTEKLSAELGYAYDWADYHDPNVSNVEGHSVKALAQYDLGGTVPNLKLRGRAGFDTYRYAASSVDNSTLTVGASYPFHELWLIEGDLGARLTQADFTEGPGASGNTSPVRHSSEGAGWVSNVTASYRGEADTAALTLSRDVQNAAGRSGAVETMAVTLQLTRRFSYELTGSMAAGYYMNSSKGNDLASRPIDETTIRFNPSLTYELSPHAALELFYEFALVQNDQTRSEARSNKVFLGFTFQRLFFE
jgi:hypothetical protein